MGWVVKACPWWCSLCKRCHDNACPTLWGGLLTPGRCGHTGGEVE